MPASAPVAGENAAVVAVAQMKTALQKSAPEQCRAAACRQPAAYGQMFSKKVGVGRACHTRKGVGIGHTPRRAVGTRTATAAEAGATPAAAARRGFCYAKIVPMSRRFCLYRRGACLKFASVLSIRLASPPQTVLP